MHSGCGERKLRTAATVFSGSAARGDCRGRRRLVRTSLPVLDQRGSRRLVRARRTSTQRRPPWLFPRHGNKLRHSIRYGDLRSDGGACAGQKLPARWRRGEKNSYGIRDALRVQRRRKARGGYSQLARCSENFGRAHRRTAKRSRDGCRTRPRNAGRKETKCPAITKKNRPEAKKKPSGPGPDPPPSAGVGLEPEPKGGGPDFPNGRSHTEMADNTSIRFVDIA